ncbi:hypothetical protein GE09DRAFT_473862 [Coniochaeta sp. 2T2.1]|nr:hypothetical protein GE09DRAFT_473862 [Coniochaeta sp. 2T2.1]
MDRDAVNSSESTPPKRALRRGTRSCAECMCPATSILSRRGLTESGKKRKVRCYFEHSAAPICVGCQRRETPCIGQEYTDVPATEPPEHEQRLKRVEYMVEAILDVMRGGSNRQASSDGGSWHMEAAQRSRDGPGIGCQVPPTTSSLSRMLHAALPSQQDVDTLFSTGRAALYVQVLCNSYSELFEEGKVRPSSAMSVLPPATAHPVVLAKKLLQIALCIQQLAPSNINLDGTRYFTLASSMVTCHEELLDSVEGLECVVYEAAYLVNCGNLRRALIVLRRAATLAHLMGIHRSLRLPKQHDPATHVSLTVIWAHVAFLERYVALLLGMPTSITGTQFASASPSKDETNSQWMERAQIDVFGLIIQRNMAGRYGSVTEIDQELNRMANSVPEKWWSPMNVRPDMNEEEMMEELIRAQSQIIHYNLLTVLHLPYLLRTESDYSKSTCLYASREVLTRYIGFRSVISSVFCCRPVDFCAFAAALALLLAHLDWSNSHMLAHQRLSDIALIRSVVDKLDELNGLNHDELSREAAGLSRKLLDLEERCSQGEGAYYGSIADNKESSEDEVLQIPYFGTVKLSRMSFASPTAAISKLPNTTAEAPLFVCGPLVAFRPDGQDEMMPDLMAGPEDWAFQGVDTVFFDSLSGGGVGGGFGWDGV